MCGIAGIVRFDGKPIETSTLDAMQRAIRHRGPDGEGRWVSPQCALLHARLSIVDLESGAQPMRLEADEKGGEVVVVFNGEIYNHRELRETLTKLGHRFRTDHSDTEVLLHGYREWGRGVARLLRGMFAFAIWDQANQRLLFSRDPIGKKPLFFRKLPGGLGVAFASVPGALACFAGGDEAKPDGAGLSEYLTFGYPKASLFQRVDECPAGTTRIVLNELFVDEQHWTPPAPRNDWDAGTSRHRHEALMERLDRAVEDRLESDVPLGCFLSGGIDSALVAALANRAIGKRKGEPLRTFTVAMPDVDYDESAVAERVAARLGTRHQTLKIDPSGEVFSDLAHLIAMSGEPIADSSILPTYWLCKAARAHVKVALSGDGGDEMFGGYDRYRAMRLIARHRGWLRLVPVGSIGAGSDGHSFWARLRRLARAARPVSPAGWYLNIVRLLGRDQIEQITERVSPPLAIRFGEEAGDPVAAAMAWDRLNYLPHDVLRKVDRASMAAGIEVRSPLLDREVMTTACWMSSEQLMPGGRPKAILRQLASQLVGSDIAKLPKRGFGLPIGKWFAMSLHDELRQRLLDGPLDTIGFVKPVIGEMLEEHRERRVDHTHRLFALLALSMWVEWRDRVAKEKPAC